MAARVATCAAALAGLLGITVLIGWAVGAPLLRSVIPGAVEMKANTAVALVAAALALILLARAPSTGGRRALTDALSLAVALLGLATLGEYAFGWQLGIDEALARDTAAAFNQAKGRMSPFAALAFAALGLGTIALARPRVIALARAAGGFVAAIGVVSLIGYLWNATEIVTDQIAPPVAVNTACGFLLLGAAIFRIGAPPRPLRARSRLETLVLQGFVPTVLLVILSGGITYQTEANFAGASERAGHTQEVRAELGLLYGSLADADAAQRDRVLIGDASFDDEYAARIAEVRAHLASLVGRVADNPAQSALVKQLYGLIDAHIGALDETGRALRNQGEAAARATLLAAARSRSMLQIRTLSAQMDAGETQLFSTRLQRAQEQRRATLISLLATLALLIAIFALLFRSIRREIAARHQVEDDLQRLNADLELRVDARTQELSFQREFLRRVIDLNPNLIFAKDKDGRFVLANQATADALGTSVDALIGKTEREFDLAAPHLAQFAAEDRQVIESGRDLVIDEEMMTTAQGEPRWLSTVKRPMRTPDGQATIVLGVAADITARKAAEDAVRRLNADLEQRVQARTADLHASNLKLDQARRDSEAASRAKSAFLANMSHEIRTPMNAILGLTHLMLRERIGESLRDRLGKVGDAARHLLQVINDILDMSKIEAGKLALNEADFALDALLSGATEMVSGRARDKGLELILDTDDLPARLRGDQTRLSQILINLLSNAVKFTETGWVRLRGELLSESGRQIEVRFEVQDTGPGIPPDRQSTLFSAFEQGDNSISRQHGGTGLGLALSRELARAMGGDAGVVSAPGAGSTFWFSAKLARASEAHEHIVTVDTTGLRALLVDDLPEARSVIEARMKSMGLEVDALESGPAALEKVKAGLLGGLAYDVMVIDWRMHPMDGIETLTQLRRMLGDAMPPSILVTASDDAAVVERGLQARFDAVILKPITASALYDTLARLLRRQVVTTPGAGG
ncbi:MAG TPA: ATP-binding protein, partial [Burkholderiaceae bacterium]